ncbi:hypothetical protein P8625_02990 [Tenacibaculum tangerinum]|uniref:Uncharacterized protein n=1 Tax=Tenacibaculum tangerinum TaxID=3038772 RepID=A0ABY8L3Z3_9FLAO|nr:hypothetical protein [Tenacibaculum tangerinum]WGH76149.1 hypothetical protein P8625_02990 [Tenacibaculum tangerinum]
MKKNSLLLVLFIILFQGCKQDDECNQSCFTPPEAFYFEIVDKESGENLFTNGTFDANDIKITDTLNDNDSVEFSFISENNINLIQIGSIGWKTEIVNLRIYISENPIFNFYIDAERIEDCCSHTDYNEITLTDSEFELDSQTGIYKILVE